jgi:hypothetical protein
VTAVLIGLYLVGQLLAASGDPLALVRIGSRFSDLDPAGTPGYDGQFYYYIARDPASAWRHMDVPAYRYQRIFYPMVVRLLALGDERLIPWVMALVNLASVAVSVAVVEALLAERGIGRWYALPVGLFAGQVFAVVAVLAEPLALCLSLVAIWMCDRGWWIWGAVFAALAALTKETQLVVVAGYVLYLAKRRRFGRALALGAVGGVPFVAWQLVLWAWLGAWGPGAGGAGATSFHVVPFGALFSLLRLGWSVFVLFAAALIPIVLLPTMWAILAAGRDILVGHDHPWTFALFLYAAAIPFLPASTALDLSAIPRFISPLVALTILYAAQRRAHRVLGASLLWMTTVVLVPFL